MPTKKRTARAKGEKATRPKAAEKSIMVENVNVPGRTTRVDAAKYEAMRRAMLKVLPAKAPGLTQTEIREAVVAHLPEKLFPGGATAGWWAKSVQLDLEAKRIVNREKTTPLRWHKKKD